MKTEKWLSIITRGLCFVQNLFFVKHDESCRSVQVID